MSKFLVIAEKPSVAQSYAKNLSAYKKEDGYLEGESCIVSWCLGHLAEYAQPEEYDPKYEKWQFDDLPILPQVWKLKVSRDKKKQFDVLKSLMNRADVDYLVNGCVMKYILYFRNVVFNFKTNLCIVIICSTIFFFNFDNF